MGRAVLGGGLLYPLDGSRRRHVGTISGFILDAEPVSLGGMHLCWGSVGCGPFESLDGAFRVRTLMASAGISNLTASVKPPEIRTRTT